ncbi:MAG TPA: polysaccharide deacetylase family protein [Chitinophagaceae bacterium]|nr:polysaccharide deacetylase family protein [Chitinophagaceae bacterium]
MRNTWPVIIIIFLSACTSSATKNKEITAAKKETVELNSPADNSSILSKQEVPILCYHHIGNRPGAYEVTPTAFAQQMKELYDSGYKTVLPDDLYEYLVHGATLPAKPVMITFDDNDKEQFTIGATEMNKYGFKGVYFIMTITINRARYMSQEQLKQLAVSGHAVEEHTWDHNMVTKYQAGAWDSQLVLPKKRLELITGKTVKYFAYPFGLWNKEAVNQIKGREYKMAFILSTKRDSTEPLYTIRRMIVPGQWTATGMIKAMKTTFHIK